jgi:hypothetical protein
VAFEPVGVVVDFYNGFVVVEAGGRTNQFLTPLLDR